MLDQQGSIPLREPCAPLVPSKELGSAVFYFDHAFHEKVPWRALDANGLHPSFEGIAMLVLHYRGLLTTRTSYCHLQNLQLGRNAAPVGVGFSAPAGNMVSTRAIVHKL